MRRSWSIAASTRGRTSGRYREGYDAAIKAKDDFAARFYLNLFPPPERAPSSRAEAIVAPLFARLLLRDDVLAALKAQPAADPEIQAACLKLAGAWPESADRSATTSVGLWFATPGSRKRITSAACAWPRPPAGSNLTMALSSIPWAWPSTAAGSVAEALATLTRSNDLNKEKEPADLAFLALAQNRLGQSEKARDTLGRLRELMKNPERAGDQEAQAFLREAETIELDQVFPADPFAP